MLDRRLMQDDDRGLFQGVKDNKRTQSLLALVVQSVNEALDSDVSSLREKMLIFISAHLRRLVLPTTQSWRM